MKRLAASVFALSLLASPAAAQADLLNACAAVSPVAAGAPQAALDAVEPQFQFLCGQVVNAITNVQPSVGIAFSGGAHTLGTATTIGRRLGVFPRVSVTARFNAALAELPDLLDDFQATIGANGQVPPMGTIGVPVGSLQGDVTVGLFNGISLGPAFGGFGAVDLLGSVSYVPVVEQAGLTEEIINAGVGARVGILKQGLIMPGISVSGMYRTMIGDVGFGSIADADPAEFTTDLSTLSLRAGISKGLLMFDFAAGAGYDLYSSNVEFDWQLDCPASQCGQDYTLRTDQPVQGELSTAAWNVYGNVGISLVLLNIVGELGYQKATDIVDLEALQNADLGVPGQAPTDEDLEGGRFFASIGVRLTL